MKKIFLFLLLTLTCAFPLHAAEKNIDDVITFQGYTNIGVALHSELIPFLKEISDDASRETHVKTLSALFHSENEVKLKTNAAQSKKVQAHLALAHFYTLRSYYMSLAPVFAQMQLLEANEMLNRYSLEAEMQKANNHLKQVLKLSPKASALAYQDLALLDYLKADFMSAKEHILEGREYFKGSEDLYLLEAEIKLAELFHRSQKRDLQFNRSIIIILSPLQKKNIMPDGLALTYAKAHYNTKGYRGTLGVLEGISPKTEKQFDLHVAFGLTYFHLNEKEKSKKHFELALKHAPNADQKTKVEKVLREFF
ncbi:MAG: hypothetical protein COX62_02150 [Deltaproteobacteria bacterium CG_4_10_14_0_2_um_filter_43_8]|nr:MAG: hypothetical protein COV43_01420 [Deltaproteobacteria bacterium CG11_big_fil_rev_8_21_14_0_20_42_23]PJA21546.1 MAG: hypothetical protein COX62_02150 [Deltaproteobacteria bacterium CG_4_10_14_0_2_um_filter_43_8]PJC63476.1 MAG: hypothetical protein CO021_09345 [Deltaproteobacteria bacterium CG_4_9_14_0_2_um_filter_42_21]